MNASMKKYDGITDFNPGLVAFSRKGLKNHKQNSKESSLSANVLAVADYSDNSELTLLSVGSLRPVDFPAALDEKLKGNAIVIAPWNRPVFEFSKTKNLGFTLFKPELPFNRFDVRQADKLHKELDTYIRKSMRGVSTKYLQAYSMWIIRIAGIKKSKQDDWTTMLQNQSAWGRYVNREELFMSFMKSRADAEYIRASGREWKSAGKYVVN